MLAVVTGGTWPRERVNAFKPEVSAICQRCDGDHAEDDVHRYWCCKDNDNLEECRRTKHLEAKARADATSLQCAWLRGMRPSSWLPLSHEKYEVAPEVPEDTAEVGPRATRTF